MKSRDGCVVPVHDEPLPCSAEFDRQTAPQITPRLQTPATVAKAKNKQRSRNGVPAVFVTVLDLINQLLLCAPTGPSLVLDFAAQRPTTTNHRQASIRRGAGAASAEAVQRPAGLHQSLVVDLLLAASAHACSLHHHGHVPQPLRLMPAGMALTREPLAAVQRDAQGDCQCKSWWPPWYLAGIPVVVVEYTSRIARRLSQCLRGAEIELVPVHLYERGLSLVNNTHLVS